MSRIVAGKAAGPALVLPACTSTEGFPQSPALSGYFACDSAILYVQAIAVANVILWFVCKVARRA
jgi:hypothetical protein